MKVFFSFFYVLCIDRCAQKLGTPSGVPRAGGEFNPKGHAADPTSLNQHVPSPNLLLNTAGREGEGEERRVQGSGPRV